MKIYTKQGDEGNTSLLGGERTKKNDNRVWAYGTVDEANSYLGFAKAIIDNERIKDIIIHVQKDLFEVGAELASIGTKDYRERITEEFVSCLENIIDEIDKEKIALKSFAIPGGTKESAALDISRVIIRKAERYTVSLEDNYSLNKNLLKYLNRLSDLIYTLARLVDYNYIVDKSRERIKSIINCNKKINREIAEYIVHRCIEKSKEINVPMVICIADNSGNPIMLQRMDNALLASIEIAKNKAYSAVVFKANTDKLYHLAKPEGELYGIGNMSNIITFGGGVLLKIEEEIIGAIGVSGGTVKQDMIVAEYGAEIFKEVQSYGTKG